MPGLWRESRQYAAAAGGIDDKLSIQFRARAVGRPDLNARDLALILDEPGNARFSRTSVPQDRAFRGGSGPCELDRGLLQTLRL